VIVEQAVTAAARAVALRGTAHLPGMAAALLGVATGEVVGVGAGVLHLPCQPRGLQ